MKFYSKTLFPFQSVVTSNFIIRRIKNKEDVCKSVVILSDVFWMVVSVVSISDVSFSFCSTS